MSSSAETAGSRAGRGIDPRGPRFGATITAVLLLITIFLGLVGLTPAATVALTVLALLFLWGAAAGVQRHPWGLLYARAVRPRLAPSHEVEDPAPPTFAQAVGFVISAAGVLLQLVGVPYATVVAAALAFVAAFLNAVFGYCLGCQIYLLLVRIGLVRRTAARS
ncbi:DUF4395 domain-containing protein [Humibacter ginsenosidimutans]|uniref:DUF4395 domain-containing protein n=1 Tax=Humibacter ginsenosidimutans TaxID=2599293 RepID=A0A5B8M0P3_9MICO|nr:DUF4395 domain-containing protein [Humibacter ginsenosidimutans]QDZ13509.1 DUF4395 domain-containing protein [Humibacter ginsenosidimutans]